MTGCHPEDDCITATMDAATALLDHNDDTLEIDEESNNHIEITTWPNNIVVILLGILLWIAIGHHWFLQFSYAQDAFHKGWWIFPSLITIVGFLFSWNLALYKKKTTRAGFGPRITFVFLGLGFAIMTTSVPAGQDMNSLFCLVGFSCGLIIAILLAVRLDSWCFLVTTYCDVFQIVCLLSDDMEVGSWLVTTYSSISFASWILDPITRLRILAVVLALGKFFWKGYIIQLFYREYGNIKHMVPAICISSMVFLVLYIAQTFTRSRSKTRAPQDTASTLSYYTFWWMIDTLRTAKDRALRQIDLPRLPFRDQVNQLKFLRYDILGPWKFLYATSIRMQPQIWFSSMGHGYVFLFLMLLDPIILNRLLATSSDASSHSNYWKVGLLSLSMLIRVTCMEICYFESTRVNNNIRTGVASELFGRVLFGDLRSIDSGALLNLMATDTDKLGGYSWTTFFVAQWTWAVLSFPVVIYFMYELIGQAAVVGMATILIGGMVSRKVGLLERPAVLMMQECRDIRSQLVKELLCSIRVVKLQVWEEDWRVRLAEAREAEMQQLVRLRLLRAFNNFVGSLCSISVPVSIFTWYTLVQKQHLDSTVAFTTLAWITQMQWSIQVLPSIYNMYADLLPSCSRLFRFFVDTDASEDSHHQERRNSIEYGGIEIEQGMALPYIKNLPVFPEISIKPGSLVMISGPVGSGKSTLLSVMAQGIPAEQGKCHCTGERAYVAQQPFLLNASIRENILFGLEFHERLYWRAVKDAALDYDLKSLPNADETMVGDNGIQLSGGQKARVALARALYKDATCYFLDDILSAVDANTGRFLWENTIMNLVNRHKTVVIVTHQTQFRDRVNQVISLSDHSVDISPFKNIARSTPIRQSDLRKSLQPDTATLETEAESSWVTIKECENRIQQIFLEYRNRKFTTKIIEKIMEEFRGDSYEVEHIGEGFIPWEDFKVYLSAFFLGKRFLVFILCICIVGTAVMSVSMNVWLAKWTDHGGSGLGIYIALGCGYAVCQAVQSITLTFCALHASAKIHDNMLQTLLHAPMSFYDRTASGQLQNKFLQDLANIDNNVPNCVLDQIAKTVNLITQIGLVFMFAPYVVVILPFLVLPYTFIFGTVRCASRDSRRLEALAHSPVYTRFIDIMRGQVTVKSFGAAALFQHSSNILVENMAQGKYANEAVNKWAQTLTTQTGCLLYMTCGVVSVYMCIHGTMTTGQLGLVLMYAANMQRAGMDYMMGLTNLESQFVSVERIAQLLRVPDEDALLRDAEHRTASDWPREGHLQLENVTMRYALHKPLVLKGMSLSVRAGMKVAVCGRTGCGKSSTFGAISRLYPTSDGCMILDGVDITTLPMSVARSVIRVVSQESVLVKGTLRHNIGPDATDEELWHCLEQVQMKSFIHGREGGLDTHVEDGGKNFSVGQRQLLCTARALMKQEGRLPKLFLCDEPTANIDLETDRKIMDVLLHLDATVLMICHRLQHIENFDRVVIMEDGRVTEYGAPNDLLKDPQSQLTQLFQDSMQHENV